MARYNVRFLALAIATLFVGFAATMAPGASPPATQQVALVSTSPPDWDANVEFALENACAADNNLDAVNSDLVVLLGSSFATGASPNNAVTANNSVESIVMAASSPPDAGQNSVLAGMTRTPPEVVYLGLVVAQTANTTASEAARSAPRYNVVLPTTAGVNGTNTA